MAHQRSSDRPGESTNDTTLSKWYRHLGTHCLDTKEQVFNDLSSSASWSMIRSINSRNAKGRRSELASDWFMWGGGGKMRGSPKDGFYFLSVTATHRGHVSLGERDTRETTKEARLDDLLNDATSRRGRHPHDGEVPGEVPVREHCRTNSPVAESGTDWSNMSD